MSESFENPETSVPQPPAVPLPPMPEPQNGSGSSGGGVGAVAAQGPPSAPAPEVLPQPEESQTPVSRPRQREENVGWMTSLQSLAVTVVIAVFVITFIVQAFQIPSESMENTLLIGDYLLVDKVHYASGGIFGHILPYSQIHRGDIIVFRFPVHPAQHFVKRVIGLPGDHIRMQDRQVFVNGHRLDETYVIYKSTMEDIYRDDFPAMNYLSANVEARWWLQMRKLVKNGELVVPPGQYFVMGDNRDESLDSRYWGFVPQQNIVGSPLVIYWSIRSPDERSIGPEAPADRLARFAYVLTHIFEETRWHRTMRLVR